VKVQTSARVKKTVIKWNRMVKRSLEIGIGKGLGRSLGALSPFVLSVDVSKIFRERAIETSSSLC
jgi:hypothetical protein